VLMLNTGSQPVSVSKNSWDTEFLLIVK